MSDDKYLMKKANKKKENTSSSRLRKRWELLPLLTFFILFFLLNFHLKLFFADAGVRSPVGEEIWTEVNVFRLQSCIYFICSWYLTVNILVVIDLCWFLTIILLIYVMFNSIIFSINNTTQTILEIQIAMWKEYYYESTKNK